LYNGFKSAYTDKSAQSLQSETNAFWNTVKSKAVVAQLVQQKLCDLSRKKQKTKANLFTFWSSLPTKSASTPEDVSSETPASTSEAAEAGTGSDVVPVPTAEETSTAPSSSQQAFSTPAQDKLRNEIVSITADIHAMDCRKSLAKLSEDDKANKMKLQKTLQEKTSLLKRKQKEQSRQKAHREAKKHKLQEMCEKNPELRQELNMQVKRGRPSLETSQPSLLSAIVEIATYGCAADDRRRTENLRSVKTLDELTEALVGIGYNISRSGVYLRLLPRRSDTQQGKRHVKTVPVKLKRAQTDNHKAHVDGKFECWTPAFYVHRLYFIVYP